MDKHLNGYFGACEVVEGWYVCLIMLYIRICDTCLGTGTDTCSFLQKWEIIAY